MSIPTPRTDAAQKYCGEKLSSNCLGYRELAGVYLTWYGFMSEECRRMEEQLAATLEKQKKYTDVLEECFDYFEGRQDADHNGLKFIPNEEMSMYSKIQDLL